MHGKDHVCIPDRSGGRAGLTSASNAEDSNVNLKFFFFFLFFFFSV